MITNLNLILQNIFYLFLTSPGTSLILSYYAYNLLKTIYMIVRLKGRIKINNMIYPSNILAASTIINIDELAENNTTDFTNVGVMTDEVMDALAEDFFLSSDSSSDTSEVSFIFSSEGSVSSFTNSLSDTESTSNTDSSSSTDSSLDANHVQDVNWVIPEFDPVFFNVPDHVLQDWKFNEINEIYREEIIEFGITQTELLDIIQLIPSIELYAEDINEFIFAIMAYYHL